MLKACIGLNCARQIDFIDRRNCQLNDVPEEIYRHEATLEELLLDSNTIQELPSKLFRLTNLRKLSLSENEIMRLSPMIANFTKLVELDLSKNCLEEVPSNIQFCRSLSVLEISCNPLLRIPDCVANIGSLTHLYLNDTALPALPREIGNLQNLIVLEARENVLRRIPPSIGDLVKLQKLDLGNNEIEDLPPTFGYLEDLLELWLDSNCLSLLPEGLSRLRNLTILDVTKNKLERFPNHFANLTSLADLHASENCIEVLPENFGSMKSLVQIKLDLNHLVYLPDSIGNLPYATEIFLFENMLDAIPASIFNIPTLEMLNVDRNHLMELPSSVGKCKSLHVLSVRENELITLPEEIGQLESLKVLDVCGNKLTHLPVSVSNLQLDAFWIAGNQPQPLISLHQKQDPENPNKKILTCPFLPQSGPYNSDLDLLDSDLESEEGGAFQRSRGSNTRKSNDLQVAFDPGTAGLPAGEEGGGKFVRFPTPFRKDMKNKHKKPKLDARPRTTVFRKGSMDDLTLHAVEVNEDEAQPIEFGSSSQTTPPDASPHSYANGDTHVNNIGDGGVHPLLKTSGVLNLSEGYLADESEDKVKTDTESESIIEDKLPPRSKLQTVEVTVELTKDPARGGLGFSIAGGKGSTPAYEDVDESIFITRIIRGGSAEKDGRLRLGDKLLLVNGQDVTDFTHMQAVTALRSTPRKCVLQVSREVLVVLPDDSSYEESKDENSLIENGDVNVALHNRATPPLISDEPHSLENNTPTTDSFSGQDSSAVVTEASTGQQIQENEDEKRSGGRDVEGEAILLDSDDDVLVEEAVNIKEEEEERSKIDKEMTDEDEIQRLADEMFEGGNVEEMEDDVHRGPYINMAVAQSLIEEAKAYQEAEQNRHREEENDDQPQEHDSNSHALDSGHDSPDMMEEKVVLDRRYSTLGMSIVGGADYVNKVFGYGQSGVYISKVSPGGSAAATGKLRIGDKILQVGGVDIEGMSHDEVVDWLISQEGNIEILVRHEPQPKELMEVIIKKNLGSKLGISIKGGAPGSHGNPLDPDDEGIFISKITKGEAAEKDGRLRVGHRILEVNGLSLLGASHIEAVHALRSAETSTSLIVCHGYSFDDYLKHNQIERVKKSFTGSVDALDQDIKRKPKILVKRSSSSASASADNIRGGGGGVTRNTPDLKTVLQELEQLRSVSTNNYDNKLEVHGEKEDPIEEKAIMEQSEMLAALEKSVEEMNETTKEASRLLEDESNKENKTLSSLRKESVEQIKERQEGKQEELKTIIDEVFVDLDDYDIISKASSSAVNSIEVTPVHHDTNDPPQSEQDDNEWEVLQPSPEHVKEKQRSQSSSELLSLNTEVILDRPESADGKRKEGPPISPKPIALISPEKLPFRDRRALYEKTVDPNKDDNRKEFRKSWAPGMLSPRSGSTSPICTKWPSSSSVGISPAHRDEQSLSVEEMKAVLLQDNQLEMNHNNQKELVKDFSAPQTSQRQLTEQNSFGESNLSISSDPPLTGSPMSPPLVDDPGFSPTSLEDEEVKMKNVPKSLSIDEALKQNPYVVQMLDRLPEGMKIDETKLDPPTSEEQARRRAWREQKREEMDREMERVRTLLTESESS